MIQQAHTASGVAQVTGSGGGYDIIVSQKMPFGPPDAPPHPAPSHPQKTPFMFGQNAETITKTCGFSETWIHVGGLIVRWGHYHKKIQRHWGHNDNVVEVIWLQCNVRIRNLFIFCNNENAGEESYWLPLEGSSVKATSVCSFVWSEEIIESWKLQTNFIQNKHERNKKKSRRWGGGDGGGGCFQLPIHYTKPPLIGCCLVHPKLLLDS